MVDKAFDLVVSALKSNWIRKPANILLFFGPLYVLLSIFRNEFEFFLSFPSSPGYEMIVWDHQGLSSLISKAFSNRNFLFYLPSQWYLAIIIFVPLGINFILLHNRFRIASFFKSKIDQERFLKVIGSFNKPNKYLFLFFFSFVLYQTYSTLESFHKHFLYGVNERLASEINTFAYSRAMNLPRRQSQKTDEVKCTFFVHENSLIYKMGFLDFAVGTIFGFDDKYREIQARIEGIEPDIDVLPDKDAFRRSIFQLDKETYSRKDVEKIISRVEMRKDFKGFSDSQYRNGHLLVKADKDGYSLIHKSLNEGDLYLGQAEFTCSSEYEDLVSFNFSQFIRF